MRAKEVMAAVLKATGLTQNEVADIVGIATQSLGQKINVRESIRANEFFDMLDALGIGVVFFVRETGEILMKDAQHGRRVVGMSDGVIYDTDDSKALASSFYADGHNEYGPDGKAQELYVDREGRYFVAEYSNEEGSRDRVRSVPAAMANAFIKQYGIGEKEPV